MTTNTTVTSTRNFAGLTADDLEDIRSMFKHSARTWAADLRDLRTPARKARKENTFGISLHSVFPSNTN